MEITIALMPDNLLQHLIKTGAATPKLCYKNCVLLVIDALKGDGDYVLCWITDRAGGRHGHALIHFKGQFLDPTLQANGGLATKYELVKTFSRDELIALIEAAGGTIEGGTGYVPPALLPDGSIHCVIVP